MGLCCCRSTARRASSSRAYPMRANEDALARGGALRLAVEVRVANERTNERTNERIRANDRSVRRWDYLLSMISTRTTTERSIDRSIATTTTDRGDGDDRSRAGVFALDRRRRERVVVVKDRPSSRPSGRLHPRVWIEKYLSVVYPVFDRAWIIARVRRARGSAWMRRRGRRTARCRG